MTLTKIAEADFLKWLRANYPLEAETMKTSGIRNSFQQALIIEWFDSVGIQIEIKICHWSKGYEFSPTVYTNFIYEGNLVAICSIDRKTATEKAIIKANEIYNAKFEKAEGEKLS